jgi:hypothetical protein
MEFRGERGPAALRSRDTPRAQTVLALTRTRATNRVARHDVGGRSFAGVLRNCAGGYLFACATAVTLRGSEEIRSRDRDRERRASSKCARLPVRLICSSRFADLRALRDVARDWRDSEALAASVKQSVQAPSSGLLIALPRFADSRSLRDVARMERFGSLDRERRAKRASPSSGSPDRPASLRRFAIYPLPVSSCARQSFVAAPRAPGSRPRGGKIG